MQPRRSALALLALLFAAPLAAAPFAYIVHNSSNPGNLKIIDLASNTVVDTIPLGGNPYGVAVNPQGTRLYVVKSLASQLTVVNTTTHQVIANIPLPGNARTVVVDASGTLAYTANFAVDSVSVIDLATNSVLGSPIAVGNEPEGIALNPSGTRLYVSNIAGGENTVSVIDTATRTVIATIPVTAPRALVPHPDGSKVYVVRRAATSTIGVIDTASNTLTGTSIAVGNSSICAAINSTGTRLYVSNFGSNNTSVVDTTTNTTIATIPVGAIPFGIAVSADDSRVYQVANNGNRVDVIDALTNSVLTSVPMDAFPVSYGQFVQPPPPQLFRNGFEG